MLNPNEKISRKERERLRQKKEIMDAALELFSLKGYHNVSMNEVAQKAEYSVGTLYNFFPNKEGLYKALLKDHAYRFHRVIIEALGAEEDELLALKAYLRAKLGIFRANVALIRLYVLETQGVRLNPKAGMEPEVKGLYRSFISRMARVFERGIEKGIFRPIARPRELAIALEAISNALLFEWVEDPEQNPYPEDEEKILSLLLEPLLNEGGKDGSSF